MTHPASGNATWQDYPSTATLITAARLENIETSLDKSHSSLLARRLRTTNVASTSGAAERQIMYLPSVNVSTGRLYQITAYANIYGSAANGYSVLLLRYTTDNSVPTTSSTQLNQAVIPMPIASTGYWISVVGLYSVGSNGTIRPALSYTGSASNNATMIGSSTYPIVLLVEDLGIDPGNSGVDV